MNKKLGYEIGIGSGHGVVEFEEACGRGSYPKFNDEYCQLLLKTIQQISDIKKIVDYGCGNLESYRGHIDWSKLPYEYIGYDAHKGCVSELRKRYPKLKFKEATLDTLPEPADLIIIKDVLIHWFDKEIKWFFDNVFENYRYVSYMHFTNNQGYGKKNVRHAPHVKYGIKNLQEKNLFGYRSVPLELIPENKIVFKKNLLQDAMKTFIFFDREK